MTIFGLNSPEIFVLLIILLFILGPKRIEKLLTSFPGFIKFLLNDEKNYEVTREEKEEEAPVLEEKEEEAPVLEEKEEEAPVLEEKEEEAPVLEEKELEISKNNDKSTKTVKAIPINLEGEKKVNRKRSVKTKEKTPKLNKKTQIKEDKEPDNI